MMKAYIVNLSFTSNERVYSAGQTLTQFEYDLLPMSFKARCSEKQAPNFDREDYDLKNTSLYKAW